MKIVLFVSFVFSLVVAPAAAQVGQEGPVLQLDRWHRQEDGRRKVRARRVSIEHWCNPIQNLEVKQCDYSRR